MVLIFDYDFYDSDFDVQEKIWYFFVGNRIQIKFVDRVLERLRSVRNNNWEMYKLNLESVLEYMFLMLDLVV